MVFVVIITLKTANILYKNTNRIFATLQRITMTTEQKSNGKVLKTANSQILF